MCFCQKDKLLRAIIWILHYLVQIMCTVNISEVIKQMINKELLMLKIYFKGNILGLTDWMEAIHAFPQKRKTKNIQNNNKIPPYMHLKYTYKTRTFIAVCGVMGVCVDATVMKKNESIMLACHY